MTTLLSGQYSKFLVAVATAAEAGLQAFWPSAGWVPLAMTGIGAVLVYLVPNVTAAAAAPPAG